MKHFSSKYETADLLTFTEEILNVKLHSIYLLLALTIAAPTDISTTPVKIHYALICGNGSYPFCTNCLNNDNSDIISTDYFQLFSICINID